MTSAYFRTRISTTEVVNKLVEKRNAQSNNESDVVNTMGISIERVHEILQLYFSNYSATRSVYEFNKSEINKIGRVALEL